MSICELMEPEVKGASLTTTQKIALIKVSGTTVYDKVGGRLVYDTESMNELGQQIKAMVSDGILPIIVHGGGVVMDDYCEKENIPVNNVNGRRITDEATLELAVKPAIDKVNGDIVYLLESYGLKVCALPETTHYGENVFNAKKETKVELGYVGVINQEDGVDHGALTSIVERGLIPVVGCLGYDEQGQAYNVNADKCAAALAKSLNPDYVFMLTSVGGIYDWDGKIQCSMTLKQLEELEQSGTVTDGMAIKSNQIKVMIDSGMDQVYVLNPHSISDAIKGKNTSYTVVTNTKQE